MQDRITMAIQKADICSSLQQVFHHLCLLCDYCQVQRGLEVTEASHEKISNSYITSTEIS